MEEQVAAIDRILARNDLSLQLMAIVPAAALAVALSYVVRRLWCARALHAVGRRDPSAPLSAFTRIWRNGSRIVYVAYFHTALATRLTVELVRLELADVQPATASGRAHFDERERERPRGAVCVRLGACR
eukprot:5198179-Pleurochrysis_carterae.AAC.1